MSSRRIIPPLSVIEKFIDVVIVNHNHGIITEFQLEKAFRPDRGNYYQIQYTIGSNVDFNSYETNLKILNIYNETYEKLNRYFGIEKVKIKIQVTHWLFSIRELNKTLLLRTVRLV
jgi:hypothetical protein